MTVKVVIGGYFGDEGKGKIISYLALQDSPDIVAHAGVGPNAGHTVGYKNKTYKLREIPCGFMSPKSRLLIGAGVLVNPEIFFSEIENTQCQSRVALDKNCGIIEPHHILQDQQSKHLKGTIGTTGTGPGPANMARAERTLKLAKDIPELKDYITDVPSELHSVLERDGNILVEGTQGTYLSLFHGEYPFVTSKDTTASQACADVGIGPTAVTDVILVFKGFISRVGSGYLKDEVSEEVAKERGWFERGTVTGRARRAAPFDFDLARRSVMLNGATQIALTKLDILFPSCKGASDEKDLPPEALTFIQKVEQASKIPVKYIGTGPDAEELIVRSV